MELRFKEENDNWEVTISPGEALLLMSYLAGKLACSQTIPVKFTTTQFKPSQPITPILDATTIQELKLERIHELALEGNGIKYLSELVSRTERELLAMKGIKLTRLKMYELSLAAMGLRLRGHNRFTDQPEPPIPEAATDNELRHQMRAMRFAQSKRKQ
jgi:hypothetical protein